MQQKPGKAACLSMGTIEKEHKSNHCKMLTTNLQYFSLFTFYFFHCNQQAKSEFTHQAFFFMTQQAHLISLPPPPPPRPRPRILLRLTHHFLSPSIFKASCGENAWGTQGTLWAKEAGLQIPLRRGPPRTPGSQSPPLAARSTVPSAQERTCLAARARTHTHTHTHTHSTGSRAYTPACPCLD